MLVHHRTEFVLFWAFEIPWLSMTFLKISMTLIWSFSWQLFSKKNNLISVWLCFSSQEKNCLDYLFGAINIISLDFPWPTTKFHDFLGLENEIIKFHDFPGFPWPVWTLQDCPPERHYEGWVSCRRTARARTRSNWTRVQWSNHKVTAPPIKLLYMLMINFTILSEEHAFYWFIY